MEKEKTVKLCCGTPRNIRHDYVLAPCNGCKFLYRGMLPLVRIIVRDDAIEMRLARQHFKNITLK
jgi:hypothetical protein